MSDTRVTYHRVTSFDWTCELANNFSFVLGLKHERQEATRWLPFVDGYGNRLGHYNESSVSLQLRYAPGENFIRPRHTALPVISTRRYFSLPIHWHSKALPEAVST